jgi:ubiquinone/menaquinone biosynthesis C-methylase UbiE
MTDNRKAFDELAEHWYQAHHWPRFRRDLDALAIRWNGAKLLNLGCGHGADFLPFVGCCELFGVDYSPEMLKQALRYQKKHRFHAELAVADVRCLPFSESSFDCAIAVAVYHHISGRTVRQSALEELKRVLKPGGEAFLTVWNKWQPRFWVSGKDTVVPWKLRERVVERYYHLYSCNEFCHDLEAAGLAVLKLGPEASYRGLIPAFSRNVTALVSKSNRKSAEISGALLRRNIS